MLWWIRSLSVIWWEKCEFRSRALKTERSQKTEVSSANDRVYPRFRVCEHCAGQTASLNEAIVARINQRNGKRLDSSHNTILNDGDERMRLFKEASEVSPAGSIPTSIQVITHFISGLYSTEVPVPQQWNQSELERKRE